MLGRYVVIAILLFSTAGVGLVTPAAASPTDSEGCITSPASVETSHADVDVLVEQPGNRSDVIRLTYKRLRGDRLQVSLPASVKVVSLSGFEAMPENIYEYTGEEPAVIEYRIGLNDTEWQYANGQNWILAPTPRHIGAGVDVELAPNGVVANDFLYIGNYTSHSTTVGCQTISVVNAEAGGSLPDRPETVTRALTHAARTLDVGHKYGEVTIFATPGNVNENYPGFAVTSDVWVTKSLAQHNITSQAQYNTTTSFSRLVLHEYVHTRQGYTGSESSGMAWLLEGSAEYLSYELAREADVISPRTYNDWLHNQSKQDGVLSNQSGDSESYTSYGRGGTYFAVLDSRIQSTSNESVESLIREWNTADDSSGMHLQREQFLASVENASSTSVRVWANESLDSADGFDVSRATVPQQSLWGYILDEFEKHAANHLYVTIGVVFLFTVMLTDIAIGLWREHAGSSDEKTPSDET